MKTAKLNPDLDQKRSLQNSSQDARAHTHDDQLAHFFYFLLFFLAAPPTASIVTLVCIRFRYYCIQHNTNTHKNILKFNIE